MTDPVVKNRVRARDLVDEFDDVLHYIHQFPETIPASKIRPLSAGQDYVWEDHMDINPTTGEITVNRLPNMEPRPDGGFHLFPFVVAATDGLNITLQDVMFRVEHVIEKPVWGSQQTVYNRDERVLMQSEASTFNAFDPEDGILTYSVSALEEIKNGVVVATLKPFTMTANGLLTGIVPENPTPDVKDFRFTVTATSSKSNQSADLLCVLHVANVNQGPVWSSPAIYNVQPGPWTATLVANDREGDAITYGIEVGAEDGFMINGSTITRTFPEPIFPEVTKNYMVVVTATSGTGARLKKTNQILTVVVTDFPNDPPVWVTPAGQIGAAEGGSNFSFQLQATDTELVTYSIASGALPAGLTMGVNGLISGVMPNVAQGSTAFSFTVNATDGENVVPRTFSISSTKTNNPPVWTTPAGLLLDIWAGQPIDLQLAAADPEGAALSYTITKPSSLAWLNMSSTGRLTGRVALDAAATSSNLEFTVNVTDGVHVVPRDFQVRIKRLAPQTINFTNSSEWIVPEGCYQIMMTWVVGGGGGGGAGHELGNGGGGAGGGTGGFIRYQAQDVMPGDRITMNIGGGGVGFSGCCGVVGNGGDGGGTSVSRNGTVFIAVTGGKGGMTSPNFSGGYLAANPGEGGAPNGLPGIAGQTGTNDKASCTGGRGEHGPLIGAMAGEGGAANGGANYTSGPGAGKDGVGPGSSGGGGGSQDRINSTRQYWKGGNGVGGFVEFTFPSQGPVGGTPPWEPSPVNMDNYITFYGPQAGSSKQADFHVNTPNMDWNINSGKSGISSCVVNGPGIWEIWSGTNYTGTKVLVDGGLNEYHIGSFKGLSNVRSAKRQGT